MASVVDGGNDDGGVYGIVGNIPSQYHSRDLRNYFSQFIETGGFHCFHFRHRPEKKIPRVQSMVEGRNNVNIVELENKSSDKSLRRKPTTCCVVKLTERKLDDLIKLYHCKHWLDTEGNSVPACCFVSRIQFGKDTDELPNLYRTRLEQKEVPLDREDITESELRNLAELNPPANMPNGNVGTQTKVFFEQIRLCKLPPIVIQKLGLIFPKQRSKRKYGDVYFDYGTEVDAGLSEPVVFSASRHELEPERPGDAHTNCDYSTMDRSMSQDERPMKKKNGIREKLKKLKQEPNNEDETETSENENGQSGSDSDGGEDWDRHECLHDDVTSQGRNKERLFEERIELKWEKGGSGLVFYTDAQYWQEKEGDFDEQTADDWDVDMSGYYEPMGGDMDARDLLEIHKGQRLSCGKEDNTLTSQLGRGAFERFSKGVGRRVMEKQGWKDGKGLGSSKEGIRDALDNEGQKPRDKRGFGYYGEKLVREIPPWKKKPKKAFLISTIYDNPAETDPQDSSIRRSKDTQLKYRSPSDFNFVKGSGS